MCLHLIAELFSSPPPVIQVTLPKNKSVLYFSFLDHAYKRSPGTVSARKSISVQRVQLGMNQRNCTDIRNPKERELFPLWPSLSAGVSISGGHKISVINLYYLLLSYQHPGIKVY